MNKVGIIAAAAAVALSLSSCAANKTGIAVKIGTESVSSEEFMMFAKRHKAETVKYFNDKYEAEYNNDFWATEYDGTTPQEYICGEAVSELKKDKMLQKLAKKEGVMKSNSYSDLMDTMNKVNEKRKKQKENGDVVYGVTEYSPYEYYSDSMAKLRISLKNALAEKIRPDEKELKEYYEEIKDSCYKKSDECSLTVYSVPQERADDAEILKSSGDIKTDAARIGAEIQEMNTDSETDRYVSLYFPGLNEEIKSKNIGSAIGPYMMGGKISFVVINDIKDGGYKSFNDVESNVLSMYLDKYIDDKIEKMSQKAKVRYYNVDLEGL